LASFLAVNPNKTNQILVNIIARHEREPKVPPRLSQVAGF
jgi:hypothetical protein